MCKNLSASIWRILVCKWDKNLKTFAPCKAQSSTPSDFPPLYGFLGLEIAKATTKSGWGLVFFTLSLCIPFKVALLFLLLHYIYI